MQHRSSDEIPNIRIHAVEHTPLETEQELPGDVARDVETGEDLLRLPRGAANLLPALEEIFAGQDGALHVFVQQDGELERDGLQGAGDVGDADGGRLGEDGFGFEHYHLACLGAGLDGGVGEALDVCFQACCGRVGVINGGCEGVMGAEDLLEK